MVFRSYSSGRVSLSGRPLRRGYSETIAFEGLRAACKIQDHPDREVKVCALTSRPIYSNIQFVLQEEEEISQSLWSLLKTRRPVKKKQNRKKCISSLLLLLLSASLSRETERGKSLSFVVEANGRWSDAAQVDAASARPSEGW